MWWASTARPSARYLFVREDEESLTEAIIRLAAQYGRYVYRRVTALLRAEGWRVNAKRVQLI
jgi:putative transposase